MHRNVTCVNVRGTTIGRLHSANSLITTRAHINFNIELAASKHTHIYAQTAGGLSLKWLRQIAGALSGSNATNICGNRNHKDKQTAQDKQHFQHIHLHTHKETHTHALALLRLPILPNGTEAVSLATVATAVDCYATAVANAIAICSMPHALDYTKTDS